MACPITYSCCRELHKNFFGGRGYLFEDLRDRWNELVEAANRDNPSDQALRLRGFYVVEVIYHDFIADRPNSYRPADERRQQLAFQQYPRSREGLQQLSALCSRELVALTADQGELHLMGGDGDITAMASGLVAESLDLPKVALGACMQAATVLSSQLRDDVTGIGHLGTLLAVVLLKASKMPERCIFYLESLLRTNIHNPVSPFNRVDI